MAENAKRKNKDYKGIDIYNAFNQLRNLDHVQEGKDYSIRNYADSGVFNNQIQNYIYELNTAEQIVLVINKDLKRKYAVNTNDSINDNLGEYVSAKMVSEVGDHIIVINKKNIKNGNKVRLIVFRTKGHTREMGEVNLSVTCEAIYNTHTYPQHMKNAVKQLQEINDKGDVPIQLINKFSYNNSRAIGYGIFQRDENDQLTLTRSGTNYILNRNSAAQRDKDGNEVSEGLIRFFYSKKLIGRENIVVDGILISDQYANYDPTIIYENPNIFIEDITDIIVKVKTKYKSYNAIVQNNGRIKIILKLGSTFMFIHLSDDEVQRLVTSIDG